MSGLLACRIPRSVENQIQRMAIHLNPIVACGRSRNQSNKSASATPVKPVADCERYVTLDALRGLALLGVLLVNDLDFFRVSLFDQIRLFHTHPGWGNHLVDVLVAGLLDFKAFTLFSLLFGVGIGIQTERLATRDVGASRLLARRFAVLLGFGLFHMFLISNVDILSLYATCGLLLIPLLRCPVALLAPLGLVAIALAFTLPFGGIFPSEKMMHEHAEVATSVYSMGSFNEILVFRWHETWQFILPLLLSVLPRTLGVILLGIAAWRVGILQRPDRYRRWLIAVALGAGSLGGVATGLVVFRKSSGQAVLGGISSALLEASSYVPLAFGYASAFMLWMANRRGGNLIRSLAALGQMSLTNYLAQSVILGLIFYSYGLGLIGRLGSAPAAAIGVVIFTGQVGFSRFWLKRYRFGPAEWLWRSMTYGEWQPMRQRREAQAQPSARNARQEGARGDR